MDTATTVSPTSAVTSTRAARRGNGVIAEYIRALAGASEAPASPRLAATGGETARSRHDDRGALSESASWKRVRRAGCSFQAKRVAEAF